MDSDYSTSNEVDSSNELYQSINFFKDQGRAKSKRTRGTQAFIQREYEIWSSYVEKIHKDPKQQLMECDAATFKAYMDWRIRKSRIKKESTVRSYWKRLMCCYYDVTSHSLDNGVEIDMRNWITTYLSERYNLDQSEKSKYALYSQDLLTLIYMLWQSDPKPLHGRLRVEISCALLLCGPTASRPAAILSISYEDIEILRVRDTKNPHITTTVARISIIHIKNSGHKARPKRFIFRLEETLGICFISFLISLAIADNAFQIPLRSPYELLYFQIPNGRECLTFRFKDSKMKQPIFRDIEKGGNISETRKLPYAKLRNHFVWLGQVAGYPHPLELYQIRRASGRSLNTTLTTAERNQTMGHHGNTYEQFYLPNLIERDFQSIYFGSTSKDELIQHVAKMGLARDERAPLRLTDTQKHEINSHPDLIDIQRRRDRYKKIAEDASKDDQEKLERLRIKRCKLRKEFKSLKLKLKRKRLEKAIQRFHNEIDTIEIENQRNGISRKEKQRRPKVYFEYQERAEITKRFPLSLETMNESLALERRVEFIQYLTLYCNKPESQRRKLSEVQKIFELEGSQADNHRTTQTELELGVKEIPIKLGQPICLICIGSEQTSVIGKTSSYRDKYVLKKHLERHFQEGFFNSKFQCRHPRCSDLIDGFSHYMAHAERVHDVPEKTKPYFISM